MESRLANAPEQEFRTCLEEIGRIARFRLDSIACNNSDDPAYFGGYVGENYVAAARALGLGRDDIVRLARNSFRASFLSPAEKQAWLDKVDRYAASHSA